MTLITHHDYRTSLEAWIPAAREWLYRLPNDPACICYGVGNHGHWALQASNTAFGAFAALAADPETDCSRTAMSRDELLATALAMFRFCVRTHNAGTGTTTDGMSWGHSWISALCLERFFHGVEAIAEHLDETDWNDLRTVMLSEADWLLDEYDVVAGLVNNNKPESNLWNGALLHRAAAVYPDAPRVAEYREKGTTFLVNAISTPSDEQCTAVVDGKPVRDRFVGANFFESFSCNHHHYMNVGYMVITLSNIAMLHFSGKTRGIAWPDALYRNVEPLWQLVKACTFPDGRLMRIGGDTRVRYCYCQDYAIPVWLMMRDRFGEPDSDTLENGWLTQVRTEQNWNGDGSFLGKRLAEMRTVSPLYYTRLEGDRAVTLSMGAYWRRVLPELNNEPEAKPKPLLGQWEDEYHGACMVRGEQRTASWIWRAAEPPQGLCLPPDASDMAEWKTNLAGRIAGLGMVQEYHLDAHHHEAFTGGFTTCGRITIRSTKHYAEGGLDEDVANQDLAFCALPDDATVVGLQRATAANRVFLRQVKGLMLQIPNDVFNDFSRTYATSEGKWTLTGRDGQRIRHDLPTGWLNVEDRLGVVALAGGPLTLLHPEKPGIPIKSHPWQAHTHIAGGFLYVDELCIICNEDLKACDAGESLFDVAFAIRTNVDADETAAFAAANRETTTTIDNADVRVTQVVGADEQSYLVAANFGSDAAVVPLEGTILAGFTATDKGLTLPPGICGLARLLP